MALAIYEICTLYNGFVSVFEILSSGISSSYSFGDDTLEVGRVLKLLSNVSKIMLKN